MEQYLPAVFDYTVGRMVRQDAKAAGCTIEYPPVSLASPGRGKWIEIIAPDGKQFATGESSLLCATWQDAFTRLGAALPLEDSAD